MATTFAVRQFFNIPAEALPLSQPTGTFIVTGSVSNLLVNNNRTNLANDTIPGVGSSGTQDGWWPGADTANLYGIIVGGNDTYQNPTPDGRTSTVSVWGWDAGEDQPTNDASFIELANYILNTPGEDDLVTIKEGLVAAGYYYQYPVGFNGQSPNTGTGSDVL
jgi:hypothetical protein